MSSIASTAEIIHELRQGRMVILIDDEDRENEGDLVLAADFVTPETINFMAKYGRGLICLTLSEARCQQLNLPLMVSSNGSSHGTNFTVSIEAAQGVSTGISAFDRARTVQAAVARDAKPADLVQPGHIFPLMAQNGGVLVRAGHTEAGCDLTRMAGLTPAAVICEIMNEDGSMARLPELLSFADEHQLKVGTIADLIHYRSQTETLIERVLERPLHTPYGDFSAVVYRDKTNDATHLALIAGQIVRDQETLVRVHEPLSVVDWLLEADGRHSWPLPQALRHLAQVGGVAVLLHTAEDGQALRQRLQANAPSKNPAKPDLRNYGIGTQILTDLGVKKARLMAIPRKMPSLTSGFGLEICGYLSPPTV